MMKAAITFQGIKPRDYVGAVPVQSPHDLFLGIYTRDISSDQIELVWNGQRKACWRQGAGLVPDYLIVNEDDYDSLLINREDGGRI